MVIPVYSNRKKAKIRFFTAYAVSVLLLLILFSSFLNRTTVEQEDNPTLQRESDDSHSAIYSALHQRMESLDKRCMDVVNDRTKENLASLNAEERAFYASIDSIRKSFVSFSTPQKENELSVLLQAFTQAAEKQVNAAKGIRLSDDKALETLKQQLVEKEQRIAELENQNHVLLQEAEVARITIQQGLTTPTSSNQQPVATMGSEWRQRYENIKAAHDRLLENNKNYEIQMTELKKTYKDLVDDNRRLLAQLQSARAGRN